MIEGKRPSPQYGWSVYRNLHSRWLDWLVREVDDPNKRTEIIDYLGGVDFPVFTLAVCRDERMRVSTRISPDETEAWIGLEFPTTVNGERTWVPLFELHHSVLGISVETIIECAATDLLAEVDALLETHGAGE